MYKDKDSDESMSEFNQKGWIDRRPIRKRMHEVRELVEHGKMKIEGVKGRDLDDFLDTMAADIGSVHCDGIFFYNYLEYVKREGSNLAATAVVDRMQQLGMPSASMEQPEGPPPPGSLRPWRNVLEWLFRKLADIGEWMNQHLGWLIQLLRNKVSETLGKAIDGGTFTVSISAGFPPAIIVGFEPIEFNLDLQNFFRDFIGNIYGQLRDSLATSA